MKKNLLLAMLAAGLLASCSSSLDEVADATPPTPEDTNGNDSDLMEIRLGNGGLVATSLSRAAIGPNEWIGTEVGIFGLNKQANANWKDNSTTNTSTDNLDCIINGARGTIVDNANTGSSPQGISFANTYYYPRVSTKNYSFYGYHPYVAPTNADVQIAEDQITCRYVITGQEDILWGKAVASPATGPDGKQYDGYNATYFRKFGTKPADPNIAFTHLLSKMTFTLVKGADYKVDNSGISEIKLISVPKNGDLVIASANVENSEGTISWVGTTVNNGTVTVDPNPAADNITDISVYKNETPLTMDDKTDRMDVPNSTVMLPSGLAEYELSVTLNGSPTTLPIKPKNGGNFLPGYAYNVALTINGPMVVDITATLTDWIISDEIDTEI